MRRAITLMQSQTTATTTRLALYFALIATGVVGCSKTDNRAFVQSHDSIRIGMTVREAFDAGLADYMVGMGNKNVPGTTQLGKQLINSICARQIIDIAFAGAFRVRVYCGMNSPSSPQLTPEKTFASKQAFLQALDADYTTWARNMEFSVESPAQGMWGIYQRFRFTTDDSGRVNAISTIVAPPSK